MRILPTPIFCASLLLASCGERPPLLHLPTAPAAPAETATNCPRVLKLQGKEADGSLKSKGAEATIDALGAEVSCVRTREAAWVAYARSLFYLWNGLAAEVKKGR